MKPLAKFSFTLLCLIILMSLVGTGLARLAHAQASEPVWSEPLNLSHSSLATTPRILAAGDGRLLAFWLDEFDKVVTSAQRVNDEWSAPGKIDLAPFKESTDSVQLVMGPGGEIYAAWLDSTNGLMFSSSNFESYLLPTGWSAVTQLAPSAADFDLTVSPDGVVYISWIQPEASENPKNPQLGFIRCESQI